MQTIVYLTVLYFLFGSLIGSFLSVCAYRIPMGKYEPIHEGVRELNRTLSIISPARSFHGLFCEVDADIATRRFLSAISSSNS